MYTSLHVVYIFFKNSIYQVANMVSVHILTNALLFLFLLGCYVDRVSRYLCLHAFFCFFVLCVQVLTSVMSSTLLINWMSTDLPRTTKGMCGFLNLVNMIIQLLTLFYFGRHWRRYVRKCVFAGDLLHCNVCVTDFIVWNRYFNFGGGGLVSSPSHSWYYCCLIFV